MEEDEVVLGRKYKDTSSGSVGVATMVSRCWQELPCVTLRMSSATTGIPVECRVPVTWLEPYEK